jgi:hypothetical protein
MKALHFVLVAFIMYLFSGMRFDIGFMSLMFAIWFFIAIQFDIFKEQKRLRVVGREIRIKVM